MRQCQSHLDAGSQMFLDLGLLLRSEVVLLTNCSLQRASLCFVFYLPLPVTILPFRATLSHVVAHSWSQLG